MNSEGMKNYMAILFCGAITSRRRQQDVLQLCCRGTGKKDVYESWPTSPVLIEEKNARRKERAHKYYERQLRACSWYKERDRPWLEVVETFDGLDVCAECRVAAAEPCGCVLVGNRQYTERKRCATDVSLDVPRVDSRTSSPLSTLSRISRASRCSHTSTEDDRSYYDNTCPSCKSATLERRARKYGEWRQRWSRKMATEIHEEPPKCTCNAENYSFAEWKDLYDQRGSLKFSRVDRITPELHISTSDYGTHKSKYSDFTTSLGRTGTLDTNIKSASIGYNTDINMDSSESSYSPLEVSAGSTTPSDSTPTEEVDFELFEEELAWIHKVDCALEQRRHCLPRRKVEKSKTAPCRTRKIQTRATVCTRQHTKTLDSEGNTATSDGNTSSTEGCTYCIGSPPESDASCQGHEFIITPEHVPRLHGENARNRRIPCESAGRGGRDVETPVQLGLSGRGCRHEEGTVPLGRGCRDVGIPEPTGFTGKRSRNGGIPVICVTPTDYTPPRQLAERDGGLLPLPVDPFTEFVAVAKSIDEFYESLHAKHFMENRVTTSEVRGSVDSLNQREGGGAPLWFESDAFSSELKQRIRSLERLCSFVDHSDEEELLCYDKPCYPSPFPEENDKTVWRLSQQSINDTLARRSRSHTTSSSNPSRSTSTSGSAPNSRSSTRQDTYNKTGKCSLTSVENICSPDSGFSEKTNSFPALNSPEVCPLGSKWAGSMQWDYTDWTYYFGCDSDDDAKGVFADDNYLNDANLFTIEERPPTPQDPLDWDF